MSTSETSGSTEAAGAVGLRARTVEDQRRLEAYEHRATMPIFLSAVLPIVLTMSGADSAVANVVLVATWFVFVADLVIHVRLIPGYLHRGRGRFDVVVVVLTAPWFLIPGMGTSRFVALARLARLARIAKASGGAFMRLAKQVGNVGLVVGLLILTCAYVAYEAERSANDAFSSYGESVWWATVTITTVGYGDIFPVTTTGRVTAAVLMFSGVGVLGVLAGSLASFFGFGSDEAPTDGAERTDTVPAVAGGATTAVALDGSTDADDLRARLDELEQAIARVRRQLE